MSGVEWKPIVLFGAMCAAFQIQPSAPLIFGVVLIAVFLKSPNAALALTKPLTNLIPFLKVATGFLNAAAAMLREANRLIDFKERPEEGSEPRSDD